MDKHYQQFKETVDALELIVTKLALAPDIQALNASERQAQQALFNLQHTSMGLAYWVQGVAQARRRDINNGVPVVELKPVSLGGGLEKGQEAEYSVTKLEEEKPKKTTKRKAKKAKEDK